MRACVHSQAEEQRAAVKECVYAATEAGTDPWTECDATAREQSKEQHDINGGRPEGLGEVAAPPSQADMARAREEAVPDGIELD